MTAFLNALLPREVFAPGMGQGVALGLSKRRGGGAPAVSGPAVISITAFDDSDDTATLNTDIPNNGNYHWATIASGSGASLSADGSGGWTGATPLETGTVAVGLSGAEIEIPYTATTGDGTRDLVIYQRTTDNQDSNLRVQAFTADSTAPVISGVSVTPSGGQLTVNWSTDTGEGQARWIAVADGLAVPTAAQVFAGTDGSGVAAAADTGLLAISGTGAQSPAVLNSLTNGNTYDVYGVHRDAHRNLSLVSTTIDQVPAAASGYVEIVEDTFTRGSDEALTTSSLWTEIHNLGTITATVFSATGLLTTNSSTGIVNFHTASWLCETTLNNDQWAEFEFSGVAGVNRAIGLMVRVIPSGSVFDGYMLRYTHDGTTPKVSWYKVTGGQWGVLITEMNHTLNVGDKLRIRASGTSTVTLECELDTGSGFSSLLSTTDSSSPHASGKSGLWAMSRSMGSTASITRFAAGNWS